jgi:catechol 2,3-dioxygenase-like lactoylglutathione lyase family enzyme
MTGIVGIDHVQMAAPPGTEREARAFYGDLLGLPEIPKPEGVAATGGAWFHCGGQELHVGLTRDFVAAAKAHPGLVLDSVAALERLGERLVAAGVGVDWDERLPEYRRFYAHDPWGNRLELRAVATS